MINYVTGFLFNAELSKIVLIRKNKPKWQEGLLNGVGGKIENEETPTEAMVREFEEETGLKTSNEQWYKFALLYRKDDSKGNDFMLHFFYTIDSRLEECSTQEKEEIEKHLVAKILNSDFNELIPNLKWLIPLALDFEVEYTINEYK